MKIVVKSSGKSKELREHILRKVLKSIEEKSSNI